MLILKIYSIVYMIISILGFILRIKQKNNIEFDDIMAIALTIPVIVYLIIR